MKKSAVLIISLTLLGLTACGSRNPGSPNQSLSPGSDITSAGDSEADPAGEDRVLLTDGVYTTYDRSKYENITAPKCYYTEYRQIEKDFFFQFFSGEPVFSEEQQMYILNDEKGFCYSGQYSNMSYWTKRGLDYESIGNDDLDFSTEKEFDFMTREEIKKDFINRTGEILQSGVELDIYAVTAEEYAENILTVASGAPSRPDAALREWSEASDFYYVEGRQVIEGVPIFYGSAGNVDNPIYCPTINAVYTQNGVEVMTVLTPYRIMGEASYKGSFLSLGDAEAIVKSKYEELLPFQTVTLEKVELVYIPIYIPGGRVMVPVWEFSDWFGPVWRINAYTGEEIL